MKQRVVVTGMGVVSPLGTDIKTFWSNLTQGTSGAGPITRFDPAGFNTRIAAEVKNFNPADFIDKKELRRMDRFTYFALAAAKMALGDAGLDLTKVDRDRVGVVLGSGIGGLETLEEQHNVLLNRGPDRISPFFIPMIISNMGAGQIAITYGLRGNNITMVSACASSNHALGESFRLLQRKEVDVVISGGSEAPITPLGVAGFIAMKALTTRNDTPEKASRPFDLKRDGFLIGEGAAILILETLEHALKREAKIYAEIIGYGTSCDAYHITAPDPSGIGAALALERAIQDAGIEPEMVDYINAHGTSTPLGDKAEAVAIKKVFGEKTQNLPVSSTKSMTGHLLGGSGGLEAVACILTICHGIIPPTINYEYPDPECDLDIVPNQARIAPVKIALNNSLGFGGHNVILVFKEFRE
ncbi:3-oxoacyl-ACP synthase [Peptococcaceae bacterium SCADC1_2_3]|nr:3-oxoacyl-ACP synthase [Peptococcaceae bacterium SCADC1_2_3]KFI36703.1 3-oxoacyl-ACP synthase [Peptococcaceae bacterium SCADC1_2_3]HBQ28450.1 beta-ketoacyl-[acyl-carrier-protein] synthase II [Desulfotomaculum sp.]